LNTKGVFMKQYIKYFVIFAVPVIMVACAKKQEDAQATTPAPNSTCLNSSASVNCNPVLYSTDPSFRPYPTNYSQYGGYVNYWQQSLNGINYNYGYSSTGSTGVVGFCECERQINGVTVYSNVAGLGCMDPKVLQPVQGIAAYWLLNGANQQWINTPQVSNVTNNSWGSCDRPAVQVCFIQHKDPCSTGFSCRPTQQNSQVGVCVRN
jgi:hypothetical protein